MATVSTYGKTAGSFMANGRIMIWKDMEFICGVMVVVMRVSTIMIRSVDMVCITGQMADDMKDGGIRASSTD